MRNRSKARENTRKPQQGFARDWLKKTARVLLANVRAKQRKTKA